jgi:ABC-type nitrate/sulfonate/bicarbonate transport system substrate-binding protein
LVKASWIAVALIVGLLAVACGDDEPKTADKLVFMAGFKAQANLPFVAVYVAQEKGFFHEQGLEVEIQHAASGGSIAFLAAGNVDVTTADAASLLKKVSGVDLPVVAIALFGQRGQQAFVALAESGMQTPKDWEGKTFGYKSSPPPEYLAVLAANGVDADSVDSVRVGFNPRILTDGEVDILAVFKSNEPDTIRKKLGYEVVVWDPADYGVPVIGLTYVTRSELIEEDPDLLERFLKATMKGLQYAFDNRGEAVDIVLRFAQNADREHQVFMLETEIADATSPLTDEHGLGWMTAGQWRALYDHLEAFEALPEPFDVETVYTDRFLKAVYKDGVLR